MVKIAEVTRMTNRAPILVPMWSFEISVLSPLHSPMMSGTATGAVICDAEGWIYTLSAFLFSGAARPTGSLFFFLCRRMRTRADKVLLSASGVSGRLFHGLIGASSPTDHFLRRTLRRPA